MDAIRAILASDERVAFGILFGSAARGTSTTGSDIDVAIGMMPGTALDRHELGALTVSLEAAVGRNVDLIEIEHAPPALAYRIFRDGTLLFERDHASLVESKTRAILEYLDFQPVEVLCARGVLRAAIHG